MPVEIERKFLVTSADWHDGAPGQRYCQGYLVRADGVTVRIRRAGSQAFVTIKGEANGLVRPEFEYPIPVEEAEEMLRGMCPHPLIEKTRYEVRYGRHVWQVDEFGGQNAGLVVAEIELDDPDEAVELPPWIGEEVTGDPRFRNSALGRTPYQTRDD